MKARDSLAGQSELPPLVCDLGALDEAQRRRRARIAEFLQVGVTEVLELADGYALRLDPRSIIAHHVSEFIELEARCCPFLQVRAQVHPEGLGPTLELRGGTGVKMFVAAQYGIG